MNFFLGQIMLFPFNFPPRGWAFCNGQLLSIQENTALFSLIGTRYGGDGIRTFQLPNLQGRTPISDSADGVIQLGQVGGQESHTLSLQEIPAHNHTLMASSANQGSAKPNNHALATTTMKLYANTSSTTGLTPPSISMTGGNLSHENRQPFLVMNWCIALVGIYPSRS